MEIRYTPEMLAYMKKKNKYNISVEVASSEHSDFDVTELYIRLVTDPFADRMLELKKCHEIRTETGRVLLPNYRLQYADVITFDRKKVFWKICRTEAAGISL